MKQRTFILLLIVASFLLSAASPYPRVTLTIINKTGDTAIVRLTRPENVYLLQVKGAGGASRVGVFTIAKGTYEVVVWACEGRNRIESLEIVTNYRFTIPRCYTRPRTILDGHVRKFLYSPN